MNGGVLLVLLLAVTWTLPGWGAETTEPTRIMNWQHGRKAAVSITYDGGTINQCKVAVPIMDRMGFQATFYIVTGDITGSTHKGEFIGRPVEEILRESATMSVNATNFFERATAVRYLGYEEMLGYHTRAGDMFELRKTEDAYHHIEEAYAKVRNSQVKRLPSPGIPDNDTVDVSWTELKSLAARGYEFGSHSVTHPQPAICDDANLRYEIEKSREEILRFLGPEHTFSAELPHGSENPRVMDLAMQVYPALRNRMPAGYLEEINRWNRKDPLSSNKEYVQWQRGPRTRTTVAEMTGWIDTCLKRDNIWLVLTFHGIDGIGYEPKTGADLEAFLGYIQARQDEVWVATFRDATKYMRERMNATVRHEARAGPATQAESATRVGPATQGDIIRIELTHPLDPALYNLPLTLKTRIPANWEAVRVSQGTNNILISDFCSEPNGRYILYQATPNANPVELSQAPNGR
jgi:peptidoglycan/xylan/chitin deacetylase (PgdA/CDA1 family)